MPSILSRPFVKERNYQDAEVYQQERSRERLQPTVEDCDSDDYPYRTCSSGLASSTAPSSALRTGRDEGRARDYSPPVSTDPIRRSSRRPGISWDHRVDATEADRSARPHRSSLYSRSTDSASRGSGRGSVMCPSNSTNSTESIQRDDYPAPRASYSPHEYRPHVGEYDHYYPNNDSPNPFYHGTFFNGMQMPPNFTHQPQNPHFPYTPLYDPALGPPPPPWAPPPVSPFSYHEPSPPPNMQPYMHWPGSTYDQRPPGLHLPVCFSPAETSNSVIPRLDFASKHIDGLEKKYEDLRERVICLEASAIASPDAGPSWSTGLSDQGRTAIIESALLVLKARLARDNSQVEALGHPMITKPGLARTTDLTRASACQTHSHITTTTTHEGSGISPSGDEATSQDDAAPVETLQYPEMPTMQPGFMTGLTRYTASSNGQQRWIDPMDIKKTENLLSMKGLPERLVVFEPTGTRIILPYNKYKSWTSFQGVLDGIFTRIMSSLAPGTRPTYIDCQILNQDGVLINEGNWESCVHEGSQLTIAIYDSNLKSAINKNFSNGSKASQEVTSSGSIESNLRSASYMPVFQYMQGEDQASPGEAIPQEDMLSISDGPSTTTYGQLPENGNYPSRFIETDASLASSSKAANNESRSVAISMDDFPNTDKELQNDHGIAGGYVRRLESEPLQWRAKPPEERGSREEDQISNNKTIYLNKPLTGHLELPDRMRRKRPGLDATTDSSRSRSNSIAAVQGDLSEYETEVMSIKDWRTALRKPVKHHKYSSRSPRNDAQVDADSYCQGFETASSLSLDYGHKVKQTVLGSLKSDLLHLYDKAIIAEHEMEQISKDRVGYPQVLQSREEAPNSLQWHDDPMNTPSAESGRRLPLAINSLSRLKNSLDEPARRDPNDLEDMIADVRNFPRIRRSTHSSAARTQSEPPSHFRGANPGLNDGLRSGTVSELQGLVSQMVREALQRQTSNYGSTERSPTLLNSSDIERSISSPPSARKIPLRRESWQSKAHTRKSSNDTEVQLPIGTDTESEPCQKMPKSLSRCKKKKHKRQEQQERVDPPDVVNELDWSGRGFHATYKSDSETPLTAGKSLGFSRTSLVDECHLNGIAIARKTITISRELTKDFAMKEVENLQKLRHPHILQLVGTYCQGGDFSILLFPVADCHLEKFISRCQGDALSPDKAAALQDFTGCLLSAITHIHQNNMKHMDIKPQNILVKRTATPHPRWAIYIADFGISRHYANQEAMETDTLVACTKRYCAPEVALQMARNEKADIFSLGCVFTEIYTVLAGRTLEHFRDRRIGRSGNTEDSDTEDDIPILYEDWYYTSVPAVVNWLKSLDVPVQRGQIPWVRTRELLRKMLRKNPKKRPSAAQLCVDFGPGKKCCEMAPHTYERELEIRRQGLMAGLT